MGKGKKRPRVDPSSVALLSNLTGFDDGAGGGGGDSMDDLMAELQHQSTGQAPADKASKKLKESEIGETGDTKNSSQKNSGLETSVKQFVSKDQIEAWNQNLISWAKKKGNYTPGLLPSIDEELARNFKVQELSSFLLKKHTNLRMPAFERWFLDSKLDERHEHSPHQSDPVLPHQSSPSSEPSKRLVDEICQDSVATEDVAEATVAELCRRTNLASQELSSQSERYKNQSPLKKGDRMELEYHDTTITFLYSRKKWKKPFTFKLNRQHYDKLRDRFLDVHNSSKNGSGSSSTKLQLSKSNDPKDKVNHAFHVLILCLMLRYSAISGGQLLQDLRGGGNQGAIHEGCFDALRSSVPGNWMEGFASPFNVYLIAFCSAFPSIEWHFGSVGNFFDLSFGDGDCVEANPPFCPGLMEHMVDHMEQQLVAADRKERRLTFAVIVPTANRKTSTSDIAAAKQAAKESFDRMVTSTFCRHHIVLSAREHGYIEGAQHLRPTKYKQSSYDTSVILLQSKLARQVPLDTSKLEKAVKKAFASRHEQELAERRKGQEK